MAPWRGRRSQLSAGDVLMHPVGSGLLRVWGRGGRHPSRPSTS